MGTDAGAQTIGAENGAAGLQGRAVHEERWAAVKRSPGMGGGSVWIRTRA